MAKPKKQQNTQNNALRNVLIHSAWAHGVLAYKLLPHQVPLYEAIVKAISDPNCVKYCVNSSRRFGKTTVLILIALEYAIKNANSQILFTCPTQKQITGVFKPIFRLLISDCPTALKPQFKVQGSVVEFPNGSIIHLAGTDNGHAENLRGYNSNLNIADEAGSSSDLEYIISSILVPQTLTTNGKTIVPSTPAETPSHYFTDLALECREQGYYSEYTLDQNTSLTEQQKELFIKEAGGRDSTTCRREYFCHFITDTNLQLVPEWKDEYVKAVNHTPYNHLFHKYVAMDLGVKDNTAILFGYYDFENAKLIIEDELVFNGKQITTDFIANQVQNKERELNYWNTYLRISDNNDLILVQSLSSTYNLPFIATSKESLESMLNKVRIWIKEGRIAVNPKCKYLIDCLRFGIWDKNRKLFGRTKTLGHFDGIAALMYLIRNIDVNTNPIPYNYGYNAQSQFLNPYKQDEKGKTWRNIFKMR